MANGRKEIAFDLDTKMLQRYYPGKDWKAAYKDIRKFMLKHNFEWRQGSVYVSQKGKTFFETANMLNSLSTEQSWLNVCMRDCTVTNVGRMHDQTYLFSKERLLQKLEKGKDVKAKTSEKEKEEEEEI